MMCACGKRALLCHHYTVKGLRYGGLPGRIRVYRCACGWEVRTFEVQVALFDELKHVYHDKFQQYIKKNAELKERVNWLKSPVNLRAGKMERLRKQLIELLDSTF